MSALSGTAAASAVSGTNSAMTTNALGCPDKWAHYFPIYERHFSWYVNKSLTFLEIGVARGGSLQMWQRYFGPLAKIVGIDIQERSQVVRDTKHVCADRGSSR